MWMAGSLGMFVKSNEKQMLKSQLPEAVDNSCGKQWDNPKENLGNEMCVGDFKKLWLIPGNL